jgi:hypothetical protein
MKYYNTIPEEQETVINIDYYERELIIYSSRKSVIQRLYDKLGEPTETDFVKNALTGATWKIKFRDKRRISIALSRPVLIAQIR